MTLRDNSGSSKLNGMATSGDALCQPHILQQNTLLKLGQT
jgi:hypothetical protein